MCKRKRINTSISSSMDISIKIINYYKSTWLFKHSHGLQYMHKYKIQQCQEPNNGGRVLSPSTISFVSCLLKKHQLNWSSITKPRSWPPPKNIQYNTIKCELAKCKNFGTKTTPLIRFRVTPAVFDLGNKSFTPLY